MGYVGFEQTVVLLVIKDEDGPDRLLPLRETLLQNQRLAKINVRSAKSQLAEADEGTREIAQQRLSYASHQLAVAEQALEDYGVAAKAAQEVRYTIRTPDYNTLLDLEDQHRTETNGMPKVDMEQLSRTVMALPEFLLDRPERIAPAHARRLWSAWLEASYPDPNAIPLF